MNYTKPMAQILSTGNFEDQRTLWAQDYLELDTANATLRKELEEVKGKAIRMFPVLQPKGKLCPDFVPWGFLSEEWARQNHSQTLEKLASRGGLSPQEMVANLRRVDCRPGPGSILRISDDDAAKEILEVISASERDRLKAENGRLTDIVKCLMAPYGDDDPADFNEDGECPYCGQESGQKLDDEEKIEHSADCSWLVAKQALAITDAKGKG